MTFIFQAWRPLQNAPFCSISAPAPWNAKPIPLGSGSNFNPRNTKCIPAWSVGPADRTGWLKLSPFLNLNKNWHFSKVSFVIKLSEPVWIRRGFDKFLLLYERYYIETAKKQNYKKCKNKSKSLKAVLFLKVVGFVKSQNPTAKYMVGYADKSITNPRQAQKETFGNILV